MKSRKEIQTKLKKTQLKKDYVEGIQGLVFTSEVIGALTQDKKLQNDLMKYSEELLDRRFYNSVWIYDEDNTEAMKLNLIGFNPAKMETIEELVRSGYFDDSNKTNANYKEELKEKFAMSMDNIEIVREVQNPSQKMDTIRFRSEFA